jgi:hypothetical protein
MESDLIIRWISLDETPANISTGNCVGNEQATSEFWRANYLNTHMQPLV